MAITVYANPGIGDAYWALMKTLPHSEVHLKVLQCSTFRSGFLASLHGVLSVEQFPLNHAAFMQKAAHHYGEYASGIKDEMYLDVNTWLEQGKRIETYLPNLDTQHRLDWKLTRDGYRKARVYLEPNKRNIVIYTSSVNNNNSPSTGSWDYARWVNTIEHMHSRFTNANFIWLGAQYDTDILPYLAKFKDMKKAVAEDADTVMHLLLNASCFVSYQSGLSVLSTYNFVPTYMLYFNKLDLLRYSWCPPQLVNNPLVYKPVLFDQAVNGYTDIGDWAEQVTKHC